MVKTSIPSGMSIFTAIVAVSSISGCGSENLKSGPNSTSIGSSYLSDQPETESTPIDELAFNQQISRVVNLYQEDLDQQGVILRLTADWSSDQFGARSAKSSNIWLLMTYGGTVRVPEATLDGFTAILCHEMGHFFGGDPYQREGISAEAQADYFAANSCLPRLWADANNNSAAGSAQNPLLPAETLAKCSQPGNAGSTPELCERVLRSSWTALNMSAARKGVPAPDFLLSDTSTPPVTITTYPSLQCRLDTWGAGATAATRPRCWFNPGT